MSRAARCSWFATSLFVLLLPGTSRGQPPDVSLQFNADGADQQEDSARVTIKRDGVVFPPSEPEITSKPSQHPLVPLSDNTTLKIEGGGRRPWEVRLHHAVISGAHVITVTAPPRDPIAVERERSRIGWPLAGASIGVTVLAAAGGGIEWLRANDAEDRYRDALSAPNGCNAACLSIRDDVRTAEGHRDVLLGVAIVSLPFTVYLVYRAFKDQKAARRNELSLTSPTSIGWTF